MSARHVRYSDDLFAETSVRNAFVAKVYMILTWQLLFTLGAISFVTFHDPAKEWLIEQIWLIYLAFAVMFITVCAITCCQEVRRQSPCNYILLIAFTIAEALILCVLTMFFPAGEVFMAVSLTAIVCFALTIFAMQTKIDFTACGAFMLMAGLLFMVFIMISMFFPSRTMLLVRAYIGVVLFSLYLIYDTQLILGGQHEAQYSPDDYVAAALGLYLDIINIFIYILMILGMDD